MIHLKPFGPHKHLFRKTKYNNRLNIRTSGRDSQPLCVITTWSLTEAAWSFFNYLWTQTHWISNLYVYVAQQGMCFPFSNVSCMSTCNQHVACVHTWVVVYIIMGHVLAPLNDFIKCVWIGVCMYIHLHKVHVCVCVCPNEFESTDPASSWWLLPRRQHQRAAKLN